MRVGVASKILRAPEQKPPDSNPAYALDSYSRLEKKNLYVSRCLPVKNFLSDYFRYPHILLLMTELLSLLCLWLPYTLLLFLIQWLRRISHFWFLKRTTRFHPFYDAYSLPPFL